MSISRRIRASSHTEHMMTILIRPFYFLMLWFAALLLTGCATTSDFKARVTTFEAWPVSTNQDQKFYVFYHPPGQEISLEQSTYENLVRPALEEAGFISATDSHAAHFEVYLFVWGDEKAREISVPVFNNAPSGVYIPGFHDPYTNASYGAHWIYPYGPGPQYMGEQSITQNYLHARLTLIIRDRTRLNAQGLPSSVYESTAVTKSASMTLMELIPLLARAALDQFPAANGSERIVHIPQGK